MKCLQIIVLIGLATLISMCVSSTIDVTQWLTGKLSATQGLCVLTAGVGVWSPTVGFNVYDNCWKNQNGGRVFIFGFQCARALGQAWTATFLNVAALSFISGWFKHEDLNGSSGLHGLHGSASETYVIDWIELG